MLNDGFTPYPQAPHVRIHDNGDETLTLRLLEDSTIPPEKIVGMDCIGTRIFTRLSMDTRDFCATIALIEHVLGKSPPVLTGAVAQSRSAAVELSEDGKIATIALQRPLLPEETDEKGLPLRKTFAARVVQLHTCSEKLVLTTLAIDVRMRYESAWMVRNCFDAKLQEAILRYIAENVQ